MWTCCTVLRRGEGHGFRIYDTVLFLLIFITVLQALCGP